MTRFDKQDDSPAARLGRKAEAAEGVDCVRVAGSAPDGEHFLVEVVRDDGSVAGPFTGDEAEAYLDARIAQP